MREEKAVCVLKEHFAFPGVLVEEVLSFPRELPDRSLLPGRHRKPREIPWRGLLLRAVEPHRVLEVCLLQAKGTRPRIHLGHEALDRSTVEQCKAVGCIVRRAHEEGAEERAHRVLLAWLEFRHVPIDFMRAFRDGDDFTESMMFHNEESGHDLRKARNGAGVIRSHSQELSATQEIDNNRSTCTERRTERHRGHMRRGGNFRERGEVLYRRKCSQGRERTEKEEGGYGTKHSGDYSNDTIFLLLPSSPPPA